MKWKNRMISAMLAGTLVLGGMPFGLGTVSVKAADDRFAGEEWYDQIATVEVNREPAHAYFTPYESAAKALRNERSVLDEDAEGSAYQMSLNGEWKFKFAQKPADREKNVWGGAETASYVENWNTEDWDTISVPSSIQAIKDEDGNFKYEKPIYSNQRYPWQNYEAVRLGENVVAPTVRNSVGHYKRTFEIPEGWDGREVFVNFEGVESAFYLYVNGERVGYAEDSYTTDEFNITSYLKEGTNTIAVEVYRWSTGSYLENQDFIRYSGIFRDVNLYSKDKVEVRDVFIKTDLDEGFEDAVLTLDASIRNLGDADAEGKTYKVTADLYEINGTTKVWDSPLEIEATVPAAEETAEAKADDEGITVTGSKEVSNPKKWYADTPNLYMLLIELRDDEGAVVETLCQRVGFRKIDKVDINEEGQEQARINGKKIMFRGTNRHETDLQDGRALTKDDIKQDLFLMKEFNVNAIRTSHYPNNPYTYALADELGVYICDEVNAESHIGATSSYIPSGYPVWNNSVMDRTKNMLERDKNHPCVVIWSLGNEATYHVFAMDENYCFFNSTQWILQRDPSRLRKYERDNRYTKGDREHSMVDIYSSQYWGVSSVEGYVANTGNKAPYIQSEYDHAMGNGLSNFKEYWDVFRAYPNGQGGFIWDWIDQSMETKVEPKRFFVINDPNTGKTSEYNGSFHDGRNGTQSIKGMYAATGSGSNVANSAALTIDVWLKPAENFVLGQQTFISRGDDEGYNLQFNAQGKLEFYVDGWGQGALTANVPESFTDGNWHRVTGTVSGRVYKLFYDGKEIAAGNRNAESAAYDTTSNTRNIVIGTNATHTGRVFNGMIDRAAVIKGALTEEDLAATADSLDSVKDNVVYSIDFAEGIAEEKVIEYDADTYYGYGGDWDETVHDNDFCANGIVNADRTPSPELYEVKKVHQEISFYDDGEAANGKVRIVNEFLNTNLNKYNVSWTLKEDDRVIGSGELTEEQKDIEPEEESTIRLANFPKVKAVGGSDYVLDFSVTLKEDQVWAGEYGGRAGEEIAYEEFELSYADAAAQPVLEADKMGPVNVAQTDESITVTGKTALTDGKDFEVVVDKTTGYISSYKADGKILLEDGPVPDYYRAKGSNDPNFSDAMRNAAENFVIDESGIKVTVKEKFVTILVPGMISGINSENVIEYKIYGNGRVVVNNTFTPTSDAGNIAKIGMKMTIPKEYERYTYFGKGPQENYTDRQTGARLAVYESTVTDQFESKRVRAKENGNRTGVRWAALRAEDGTGVLISSSDKMESRALHYTSEDLNDYDHPYEIPKQENTILSVALVSRGLGSSSCGPGPLSKYIISPGKTYSQIFSITPITEATDNKELTAVSNVNVESGMPLSGIRVKGVEIPSFTAGKKNYNYTVIKGTLKEGYIPQIVPVKASDDVEVTVTQATQIPGDAVIRAVSSLGVEETYTVHISETAASSVYVSDMDWEINEGGYHANARDECGCGAIRTITVFEDGNQVTYPKGLGTHAPAQIGLRLEGMGADLFTARIGISACQTGTNPNVNFVVIGDGVELFRKNDVRARQSFPVSVDISGVELLSLVVETNGADSNDHGVWADAKILALDERIWAEGIEVSAENTKLIKGDTTQAQAVVSPANASNQSAIWSSSNESVARVDKKGVITAVGPGEADITAETADGTQFTANTHVTVLEMSDVETDLKNRIDELEAEIGGLKDAPDQILQIQKEITRLKKEAEKIETLKKKAEENAQKVIQIQAQIDKLQDEAAKIEDLETESGRINELYAQIGALKDEAAKMEDVNKIIDDVNGLNTALQTLQGQVEKLSDLENEIGRIDDLETELNNLKTEANKIPGLVTEVAKIEGMQSDIAELKQVTAQLDDLKKEVDKISGLREDIDKLKEQADKIAGLEAEVSKIKELQTEIGKLKEEAKKIADLQNKIEELEKESSSIPKLQEEISKLQKDKADALAAIKQIQDEIAKLKVSGAVKAGDTITYKNVKYRVTNVEKKQAEAYGVKSKGLKSVTIASSVKIGGVKLQVTSIANNAFKGMTKLQKVTIGKNVTAIGKKAFYGDKKLKSIVVKGKGIKSVGASAFKNISSKAVIKVPSGKKADYKKLFAGKGQKKSVTVK